MCQMHPGPDQLHSVTSLLRCEALLLVNWLSIFRNKLAHKSSSSEIFPNISILGYENTRLSRNVAYQIQSGTTLSGTVTDGQK